MNSPVRVVANKLAMAKALYGFFDLLKHPEHLDRVFEISETMVNQRLEVVSQMRDHFAKTATGASALEVKPRLHVNLAALSKLPTGTLGRVFADHMRDNNLDPAAIPSLAATTDLDFLRAHLYETHDVWHAVTGFGTDVAGELGLQAFYAAQGPGGLPLVLIGMGFLNTALYSMDDRERRLDAITRGWQMGRQAQPLFGVRWDLLWSTPIDAVRRSLGVEPYESAVAALAA